MKIITLQQIRSLSISPASCVEWVKESFSIKKESQLPAKISVHPQGYDFYTAMPCLLPERYDRVALKMVHRVKGATPSLGSDLLLYKASTGELLAVMDAMWITAMRTGATATLAAQTLRRGAAGSACASGASRDEAVYGLVGLGNTARATVLCLLEAEPQARHTILLQRYKDQADLFIDRFKSYNNVEFIVVDSFRDILARADVIFSCITDAQGLFCEDESLFRPGCTLIPIHVRGFQNCDLFFDKVFGDDTDPLRSWKNFDSFRSYAEFGDVLAGTVPGRTSDTERILSYNYGLGLHDALFASKIYDLLTDAPDSGLNLNGSLPKFWI